MSKDNLKWETVAPSVDYNEQSRKTAVSNEEFIATFDRMSTKMQEAIQELNTTIGITVESLCVNSDKIEYKPTEHVDDFDFCDLPFDDSDKELKLLILSNLPATLTVDIVNYGIQDTEVRDCVFLFLVENQFDCTVKEFYDKGLYKNKYTF